MEIPEQAEPSAATPNPPLSGRRPRDRRGRGLRGTLTPRSVPISQSRAESFDVLVLAAVEHVRLHAGERMDSLEFAVEDVPDVAQLAQDTLVLGHFDEDVLDDNGVPVSRLFRAGVAGISAPVIVLYRRPLEARARHREELPDLVHDVIVEQVARALDISPDELDPGPA
jgi:predicted Zn-dependent protease with MMP-like domain